MVQKAYSIFDHKSEIFNKPFFAHTHGDAERQFTRIANDSQSTIYQFPEDYVLFHIGEYDDNSGRFISKEPEPIIKAIQVKETLRKMEAVQ